MDKKALLLAQQYTDEQIKKVQAGEVSEEYLQEQITNNPTVAKKMNSIYTNNLGESHITDCQEGDIRNLKMEGRTEQNGTPSPEYPQEINSVELIKVRVCGKNLARLKLGYVWNTDGSLEKYTSNTRIALQDKIKIDNQGLILSYTYDDTSLANGVSLCVVYFDENEVLAKRITGITSKEYTVDTSYQSFSFFLYTKSNEEKFTANNIHIQLEKGLEVTEYESYKEQEFTITPPRPMNAIGDYKDICDVENGLFRYFVNTKFVSALTLKQPSSNSAFVTGGIQISNINGIDAKNMGVTELVSDKFRTSENNENNVFRLNSARSSILFYRTYTRETTETITDITILYPSTEETEPINPEDLEKLRALQTYYGTTNLYVTDQDGNDITTWFDYHFNLKPYVEYVKEQISDSKELIYDMQARQLDSEVSNAWAYINSAYAESVADFS